jgi:parallel beta-helix repeat protein
MKKINARIISAALIVFLFLINPYSSLSQQFVHPGIAQRAQDLEHMKKLVLSGSQPYKAAFDRLKSAVDTTFTVKAHTHVLRGPYGRPNIGGDDLSKSANMAYNYALAWYITNNKTYANKAIEILNAWSPVLWHFDYNDAKLLAAWTGHMLCNAAEILRYTNSGWQQKDISSFSNMLMTAYYPLIRYYYPQANGNWDGAIIHSIMAIAVFTDNRSMFNNAVDHYLHAPFNGSLFKYIYPSGQCQETMRDQGHVQLGLGEFAGAAQLAYTQGTDLYSPGNNRLALGYEFTAGFLMGEKPFSYGEISERAKGLRDDYESVYRHYTAMGVEMPFTKKAADSVRPRASRSVLTAVRAPAKTNVKPSTLQVSPIGYIAGAGAANASKAPENALIVSPGESIQGAIDAAAGTGKLVFLKAGIHTFPATLRMKSNVTLVGEGVKTILFLDPASGNREAIVNAENDLHDVTIRDLVIETAPRTDRGTDPNSTRSYRGGYNRGGIIFRALHEAQMKNITLQQISVQNATYNGVFISGAENVKVSKCDFSENGGSVVPGPALQHNLLLTHCTNVIVEDSRLDTSPYGSGIALDHCSNVLVKNCEIARNGYYGILVSESKNTNIEGNLVEANDRTGIMVEFFSKGSENLRIANNIVQYNNGYGVETYAVKKGVVENNKYAGNGNVADQQKVTAEKVILMK